MNLEVLKTEHIDDQLNYIYQTIDILLLGKKYECVNDIILEFMKEDFNITLCIGVLTISSPWSEQLNNRNLLCKYTMRKCLEQYNNKEARAIMKGL